MNNRYNNILFDWDGCLIDSLNLWKRVMRKRLEDFGIRVTDKEIVEHLFGIKRGYEYFGLEYKQPFDFWNPIIDDVVTKAPNAPLHEGVEETLDTLHSKGVVLGIVTSTTKEVLSSGLDHRAVKELFSARVTAKEVEKLKPNPSALYLLMARIGAEPEMSIIVGDSPHDIQAGKNAGIDTCLFFPKKNELFYTYTDLLAEEPTYFIKDFSDLLDIVL